MPAERKLLTRALALLALLTMLVPSSGLLAQGSAVPPDKSLFFKDLVGSWQGANDIGINFLLTFNRGRTYTVTFSIPGAGAAHGHGAWERTGPNTFESTDVAFVLKPADGTISLIQQTQASFTVGAGNDTVDIDLTIELSLPDGTPVDSLTSFATAKRVEVIPFP